MVHAPLTQRPPQQQAASETCENHGAHTLQHHSGWYMVVRCNSFIDRLQWHMPRKFSKWKKAQVCASRNTIYCFLNLTVPTAMCQTLMMVSDGLHFKNIRGFKVHDRKTSLALGRYTKLHRNAVSLLCFDKKKYALKA